MSESSPEAKTTAELVAPQKTEQPTPEAKVPVSALAKERADKREARTEADALKQQLAETQKRSESDMQALIESLAPYVTDMVAKATEEALKPEREKQALLQTAIDLGLNGDQATALAKLKAETPGLSDQRALSILRIESPDLFPQSRQAIPITGITPSGTSPFRQQAPKEDFMAKMIEARKSGDNAAAQQFATMELFRRVDDARQRRS